MGFTRVRECFGQKVRVRGEPTANGCTRDSASKRFVRTVCSRETSPIYPDCMASSSSCRKAASLAEIFSL